MARGIGHVPQETDERSTHTQKEEKKAMTRSALFSFSNPTKKIVSVGKEKRVVAFRMSVFALVQSFTILSKDERDPPATEGCKPASIPPFTAGKKKEGPKRPPCLPTNGMPE